VDVVARFFPEITPEQRMDLLWCRTPFPFIGGEGLTPTIKEAWRLQKARAKRGLSHWPHAKDPRPAPKTSG
jgi:hypothetical protein